MRVVQINSFGNLSTGSVMRKNHQEYSDEGATSWMVWGRTPVVQDVRCEYRFGSKANVIFDGLLTRLDGKAGFHSKSVTKGLIRKLEAIDPDIVHLHNLHGYYVNIEMLFRWLASHRCQVRWTLHDCWAFTGHCAYFTYVKCSQWKNHCAFGEHCPQIDAYPKTISQSSVTWNYARKKELFCSIPANRMTIITPSKWLANLVGDSFLSKYPVEVRYNTIDTDVFKPTPSNFRERYGIGDRFMILGVASTWTERKGLEDFKRLASELDGSYAVVLVGLTKRQIKEAGNTIVGIPRTSTPQELAAIYTAADLHVQPSIEETFGMTVAESQACSTSVVVMKGGACEETANPELTYVSDTDFDSLKATVIKAGGGCVVILFECTDNREQLAALYTTADVLFNPTREENYPTVNLEAEACGTPVVTYDTGGCAETIHLNCSRAVSGFEEGTQSIYELASKMMEIDKDSKREYRWLSASASHL